MPQRKQKQSHQSLLAIVLLAALLSPSTAKRVVMAARALRLLDDNEASLAIAALGLDEA